MRLGCGVGTLRARAGGLAPAYSFAVLAVAAGAVAAFDPEHVHVDALAPTLADVLLDQSGNARDATQLTDAAEMAPVASDAAFNNRAVLAADGARYYETAATVDISAAYTASSVVLLASLKNWQGLFRVGLAGLTGAGGTDGFVVFGDSAGKLWWASPDASGWYWLSTAAELAINTPYIITVQAAAAGGATRKIFKNGVDITANGAFNGAYAHPTASKVVSVGGGFNSGGGRLNGKLAPVLLAPTVLGTAARQAYERAVGAYYGISVA
jgi:hypothetical protein